jgi:NADH dehydrogenase
MGTEHWPTKTVLWAAGVKASPLGKALASACSAQLDRAGRLIVEKDFSLAGRPEVFVLGDMSSYSHQRGKPLPGVAQPAIQEGRFVAKLITARIRGKQEPTFHYKDLGNLATIGRSAAVVDVPVPPFGQLRFSGLAAWLFWLFIHIYFLIGFRNRLVVLLDWASAYVTFDRHARVVATPPLEGREGPS